MKTLLSIPLKLIAWPAFIVFAAAVGIICLLFFLFKPNNWTSKTLDTMAFWALLTTMFVLGSASGFFVSKPKVLRPPAPPAIILFSAQPIIEQTDQTVTVSREWFNSAANHIRYADNVAVWEFLHRDMLSEKRAEPLN